jgi:hypothetical protein
MFDLPRGVVDAWINPNITPELDGLDVTYLFPGLRERMERGTTLEQLVDEMDAAGVDKGLLCSGCTVEGDREWVMTARDKHPPRHGGTRGARRHLLAHEGARPPGRAGGSLHDRGDPA